MWDGRVRLMHEVLLRIDLNLVSGSTTGLCGQCCLGAPMKYPGTAFLRGRVFFWTGTASVGRYGGHLGIFAWILGGSGPLGPDGRNFSSLYQFFIGFRYSLVLKNQVPVVIYGIHGAWIYSTPYVPVPQILDLPDLPDLSGTVNLGSVPNPDF